MTERRVVIGGHEPARDARAIRWLAATLLATTLLAAPQAADAACSPSTLCPGTGDCTITGTNTVDNACFLDFGTRRVTVHNTAKLKTSTTGHSYTVSAGQLTVRGTLEAYGGILVVRAVGGGTSNGSVATEKVSNSPGKIDVRDGGIATVIAAGDVSITGQDVNADGGSPRINGGAITLRGTNVTVTGPMHADGALGGDGGDIRIEATADVTVSGTLDAEGNGAPSGSVSADGGRIDIRAGDDALVSNDVRARGDLGGDGGRVRIRAVDLVEVSDNVNVNGVGGSGGAEGGDISIEGASVELDGDWTAVGNSGARGGSVDVTATTGTIVTVSGSSIDVSGGGTGGGLGGTVRFDAPGDITVAGPITSIAGGTTSEGGEIAISSGGTLAVNAALEARSTTSSGSQEGSIIDLDACTVTIAGHLKTRSDAGSGQVRIQYVEGFSATGIWITADAQGGTRITCACTDVGADGTCDTPLACASAPSFSGVTQTPSAVVETGGAADCS